MRFPALPAALLLLAAPPTRADLEGPLKVLEPLLGTWEVEAEWSGGTPLWARTTYEEGPGGRFLVARTWVIEGAGELTPRYLTVFAHDADRDIFEAHVFGGDGRHKVQDLAFDGTTLSSEWTEAGMTLRDLTEIVDADTQRWQVYANRGSGEPVLVMDGEWLRVNEPEPLALPEPALGEHVAALEPYIGVWELEAAVPGGGAVHLRNEYAPEVGGAVVAINTWHVAESGAPDRQSITVFARGAAPDAPDTLRVVLFESDGSVEVVEAILQHSEDQETVFEVTFPANDRRPGDLRQTVQIRTPGTFDWKLWMRTHLEDADWARVMEGVWHKQRIPMSIAPIDTSLFDVTGTETNEFALETTIEAPAAAVFAAWTDGQSFREAFDPSRPELAAHIDLAIGGRYEWLFDGETGSNGCQVLSYIPDRMVSFTWNAPPDQPESRARRTWVVVELEELEGATHLRLTHLGFGQGEHWDETRAYFQQAWSFVLGQFQQNLAE